MPAIACALKEFACNGTVVEHEEYGEVIQLQGDQRQKVAEFLVQSQIAKLEQIKVSLNLTSYFEKGLPVPGF